MRCFQRISLNILAYPVQRTPTLDLLQDLRKDGTRHAIVIFSGNNYNNSNSNSNNNNNNNNNNARPALTVKFYKLYNYD